MNTGQLLDSCFWIGKYKHIKEKLDDPIYKNLSPSMTIIRYWFNEFIRGRTSVLVEERPGRLNEVTTEEIIEKIHDIVLSDRRVKLREILRGISKQRR